MFYLTYIRQELVRRKGRTILTVLGLAVGIALVVAVAAMTTGLDRAQRQVLGPLATVGTDLLVTRPVEPVQASPGPQQGQAGFGGFGLGGPGGAGGRQALSPEDQQALLAENRSIVTDLSKLGKPGERFEHDFFLPATQLTFPASDAGRVAKLDGVAAVSTGLTLLATHQTGTVPELVAELQTGGETFEQTVRPDPLTPEEEEQVRACVASQPPPDQSTEPGQGRGRRAAVQGCLPERFRELRARFTTPLRTLRQVLDPPQTDITSEPYTIAGVDPASPELALLTPGQISEGRFVDASGQAVLAEAYAQRKNLKPGGTLTLNGTPFAVVGLAKPPVGGQSADVYLPLADLQKLAAREGRVNVLLVRAANASRVEPLESRIETSFPGARVSSARDLANQVSGSLVDAAKLASTLGVLLAAVALAGAFLIAGLLTASSVAKRVRELGTLKAIGWRQGLVVRQIVGESLVQGALGGIVGAIVGVAAAASIAAFGPSLTASAQPSGAAVLGLGRVVAAPTTTVALEAPVHAGILLLAVGLALVGGLAAGAMGALRASSLRPADALREVG